MYHQVSAATQAPNGADPWPPKRKTPDSPTSSLVSSQGERRLRHSPTFVARSSVDCHCTGTKGEHLVYGPSAPCSHEGRTPSIPEGIRGSCKLQKGLWPCTSGRRVPVKRRSKQSSLHHHTTIRQTFENTKPELLRHCKEISGSAPQLLVHEQDTSALCHGRVRACAASKLVQNCHRQ